METTMSNPSENLEMMLKVADRAAERTANGMRDRLRVEIKEAHEDQRRELSKDIDNQLKNYFGMTPIEHAMDHEHVSSIREQAGTIKSEIITGIANYVVVVVLAAISASLAVSGAVAPAKQVKVSNDIIMDEAKGDNS